MLKQSHLKEGLCRLQLGPQSNHVDQVTDHALQLRAIAPIGCCPHHHIILLSPAR